MAATKRKQSTPIGTVSAMPWAGVPVTTARRAAALLRAKLAAERTARVTPSTRVVLRGALRQESITQCWWLSARRQPRPRSAPSAFVVLCRNGLFGHSSSIAGSLLCSRVALMLLIALSGLISSASLATARLDAFRFVPVGLPGMGVATRLPGVLALLE